MSRHSPRRLGVGLAILLSLVGLMLSAILLQHHVSITLRTDPILGGLCETVESASCDDVLASKFGKIAGLPTALWGFFFFAAAFSWFLVVGLPQRSRRWLHVIPVLATAAGTFGCVFLAAIMYTQLDKWCPLCAMTHLVTTLLFVTSIMLWLRTRRIETQDAISTGFAEQAPMVSHERSSGEPTSRSLLVALLLAITTSAVGWSEYRHQLEKAYREDYEKDYQAHYEKFAAQEQVAIPITPDDPIRGPADAPHTVVVFSDFQCPFCQQLHELLRQRAADFPGQFRVIYKHFPMNTKCNEHIKRTLHAASCAVAITAEAARLVSGNDAFWKMHDELFADPKAVAKNPLGFVKEASARIGIDHDKLWKRINSRSAWNRIYENIEQGHALDIDSTPIMFFDGRKLRPWGDRMFWKYLLRVAPKEKASTSSANAQPASGPADRPQ